MIALNSSLIFTTIYKALLGGLSSKRVTLFADGLVGGGTSGGCNDEIVVF